MTEAEIRAAAKAERDYKGQFWGPSIRELMDAARTLDDAPVPKRSSQVLAGLRLANGVVSVEERFDPRRKAELVEEVDFSSFEGGRIRTRKKIKKQPYF